VLLRSYSKFHPITGHEDPEREYMYSSTLSLTSAIDRAGGQRHALAVFTPGKTRHPLKNEFILYISLLWGYYCCRTNSVTGHVKAGNNKKTSSFNHADHSFTI